MPAWPQRLIDSCIRVSGGTGFLLEREAGQRVIVTAAHVVGTSAIVNVAWPGGSAKLNVYQSDKERDVAIVSDHPGLAKMPALKLAAAAPAAGEPIAFAGYPVGWAGSVAVLQRGSVAASSSDEMWIDASANPGNSGGPIVTHDGNDLSVVGVLMGRAGDVDGALRDFSSAITKIHGEALAFRFPMTIGNRDVVGDILRLATGGMVDLANLMERHFRSGLVRCAGTARLLHVLGPK
jgi:hypothetical protein